MTGDYSRRTFDPKKDFSAVLMQQGRVQLDADWNELVEILDRRLRAETTDIIGRCTVPKETPQGFEISIGAKGKLFIGPGRIYVDGLLVENHGKGKMKFDGVLAEERGTSLAYDEQPYLPKEIAPRIPKTGRHIVYIDAWQREVTYVERDGGIDDLIEKAVGVDTTTRLQTVWQVKLLPDDVGYDVACGTPDDQIDGWVKVKMPSGGRLSTKAVGVEPSEEPCKIPPSGGYTGLENRLYRVEIHDAGPLGKATFKWSRDNASVAARVTSIPSSNELVVERTGRDSVLRFNQGDWVEITDDWREFSQPPQPGFMAQILLVDDATQKITLKETLPKDLPPQRKTDPSRHTRVRRWDQAGIVKAVKDVNERLLVDLNTSGTGVIPVPGDGASIILEDGVRIIFSTDPTDLADGQFHVGDYWNFAARTANASVEELQNAPPRGIHHHYGRLAIVTLGEKPDVTNCPAHWPPDVPGLGCDCSKCVTAESHNDGTLTIQRALEEVMAVGGTVCLGTGVYNLGSKPVRIAGAQSIRMKGQGWSTILKYTGPGSAITIERSVGVTMEEMTLLTADDPSPAVSLQNCQGVTLQRCLLRCTSKGKEGTRPAVGLGGVLAETRICKNAIFAPTGIGNSSAPASSSVAPISHAALPPLPPVTTPTYRTAPLLAGALYVQDNVLSCSSQGISLVDSSIHVMETRLSDNFITGCPRGAIVALGLVTPGSSLDIQGNRIQASGPGIVVGTDEIRLTRNDISAAQAGEGGDGILLTTGYNSLGIKHCQVLGNRITDIAGHGISICTTVESGMISQNVIESVGGSGILMNEESTADILSITNNHLVKVAPSVNDEKTPVFGIRLVRAGRAEVVGNSIIGVGQNATLNPTLVGIQVSGSLSAQIVANEIADIGPQTTKLTQCALRGIECLGTFDRVDLIDNRVLGSWKGYPARSCHAVHIEWSGESANIKFLAIPDNKNAVLAVYGNSALEVLRGREMVGFQGNLVEANGEVPAVFLNIRGTFLFNSNRCLMTAQEVPAVSGPGGETQNAALAGAVIVNANYLEEGGALGVAVQLDPSDGPYTILGNISGKIMVNGKELGAWPTPWEPLNVIR